MAPRPRCLGVKPGPTGRASLRARTRQLTSQAYEGIAVHRNGPPGERQGNTPLRPGASPRQFQRQSFPRQSDPRRSDPRRSDPRRSDPRYADQRHAYPRYGDDGRAEYRYADNHYGDNGDSGDRYGDYRHAGVGRAHQRVESPPNRGDRRRPVRRHVKPSSRKKKWIVVPVAVLAAVLVGGIAVAATGVGGIRFRVVAPVTVQALGVDVSNAAVGQTVTAGAKVVAESRSTLPEAAIAVTGPDGTRIDFPHVRGWKLGTSQKVFSASRSFDKVGTYRYWFTYKKDGRWIGLNPKLTFTVGGSGTPTPGSPLPGATPTPGASPLPGATPTPGATPSPSGSVTTPPVGSPTTAAPAPNYPPAQGPTAQPQPGMTNCRTQPSRCGYPDATNTGVPSGTALTVVNGGLDVSVAGTVIQNKDIRGCVTVRAANVTIRKSRIACSGWHGIASTSTGLLVEDTEISCLNARHGGIDGGGFTARRVDISRCENGLPVHRDVTVEDSWVHDLVPTSVAGAHSDGAQLFGGTNIVLRHNTILVPGANAAITRNVADNTPSILIENNFLGGGTYTLYCPYGPGSFQVRNNRFADGMQQYGLSLDCGRVPWTGNFRDSNGSVVGP